MSDIVERAEAAIAAANENGWFPISARQLIPDLLAEVKRLRWQYAHSGDHMCDECWPE